MIRFLTGPGFALLALGSLLLADVPVKKAPAKKATGKSSTSKSAAAKQPAASRGAAPRKSTAVRKTSPARKSTSTRKKPAVRTRATARRAAPRAPSVTPQIRAAANDTVAQWLNVPGTMENPAALVPFFEQLYRLESGVSNDVLHVLHYGDSHTAADEWSGTARYLLQARFGDGGPGFTHAGRPWLGYRRLDIRSWSSNAWHSDGLVGRDGDGMYGMGGVSMTATRAGEKVTLQADCETAELEFLRQPGGGSVEISDNGTVLETISTAGETGAGVYPIRLAPGSHLLAARTTGSGPVRLFGWVTENTRGITYDMMGVNGAQANIGLKWDETVLGDYYTRRPPSLIILAYGTNEARNKDWTRESYRDMFIQLLDRYRRLAPAASILVVGPPDHLYRYPAGWAPHEKIDLIVDAQREAALSRGAAFWDLRARMGGKGAMRQWVAAGMAQGDYVHFTGPGYRLLGAALYKELMGQFATYVRVRNEPTSTKTASVESPVSKVANEQANENH